MTSALQLEGRVRPVEKVPYDVVTALDKKCTGGVGIEITEKDPKHIRFFMSLLGGGRY